MIRSSTLALVLAAVALLAVAGWWRAYYWRPPSGAIFEANPQEVRAVRWSDGSRVVELLRQEDGGWRVVNKEDSDLADPQAVARVLQMVCRPPLTHRLPASEARAKLRDFGLRSPKRWIEVEERRRWRVVLGREAAIEGLAYARLEGEGDVVLVLKTFSALADLPFDELRLAVASLLAVEDVERVLVRGGLGEVELTRGAAGWEFQRPLAARADSEAVEKWLETVLRAPVRSFEVGGRTELGSFGITPGRNEVAIFPRGPAPPWVLRFGSEAPGDHQEVFAWLEPRAAFVRFSDAIRQRALGGFDALRDRRLLPVMLDTVDAIRVRRGGQSLDLVREREGWRMEPGGSLLEAARVEAWVRAFELARVEDFLREAPPRPPDATVTFLAILSENTPEADAGTLQVASVCFWREEGRVIAQATGLGSPATLPPSTWNLADPCAWPTDFPSGSNPEPEKTVAEHGSSAKVSSQ